MAYLRLDYIDRNGRNNESAYTHIESYSVNVIKKTVRINLITYISEEAKDLKYSPIEQEIEIIRGIDYDNIFGEKSVIPYPTTRNSDSLRVIYEKLNKSPKWKSENVESVFEIIIKDVGKLKVDEEISRKIVVDKKLIKDEDYKVVHELVEKLDMIGFLIYNKESSSVDFEEVLPDGAIIKGIEVGFLSSDEYQTLILTTDDYTLNDGNTGITITNEEYEDILNSKITVEIVFTGTYIPA